jgi:hypothetical protein
MNEHEKRIRAQALDEAAVAVTQNDRAGRAWVRDSLWDNITRESASRIRALKDKPVDPPLVTTVWKDGTWKQWHPHDAMCARDDPDWLTEVSAAPLTMPTRLPAEPLSHEDSLNSMAQAWEAVFKTLEEVVPGWRDKPPGQSMNWACDAIRELAAKHDVPDVLNQRVSELLADHLELNMSNYNDDDVTRVNDWSLRAHDVLAEFSHRAAIVDGNKRADATACHPAPMPAVTGSVIDDANTWWRTEGYKGVFPHADRRGWEGAAVYGYTAGLTAHPTPHTEAPRTVALENVVREVIKDMRKIAEPVGPLHSSWDDIFEYEAVLKGDLHNTGFDWTQHGGPVPRQPKARPEDEC